MTTPNLPAPQVPDWAADAVWYQIFPDRFRNACPASDPTAAYALSDGFPGWRPRPWNLEWYAPDDWERPHPFFKTVFRRRYGGDLPGVRRQIPHLLDLGVNAVYLNPVFAAPSLHKYDATCHHHVDPTLGPDRDGDLALLASAREDFRDPSTWVWTAADRCLLDLVADLHAHGVRVILDGVFNHAGATSPAFQSFLRDGPSSPFADWFSCASRAPDGTPVPRYWDGSGATLPEFARTPGPEGTLLPGPRRYLFDITRRWMDPDSEQNGAPARGVDGWRLDVAYDVPHGFWRSWHALVRSIRPDAYTVAELVSDPTDFLNPAEFAASMNYEWLYPALSFFTPHPAAIHAAEFRRRVDRLHARHPWPVVLAMQNLLSSHDTARILTCLESAIPPVDAWDPYFNWPKAPNPDCRTTAPGPRAKALHRLLLVWQFTSPGAPMIFAGDEYGVWGANDPCCRQPVPWPDLPPPDPETRDYFGHPVGPHSRAPDLALCDFIRSLARLRRTTPALRRGDFRWIPDLDPDLLAYTRTHGASAVHVALNRSPTRSIPLPPPFPTDTLLPPLSHLLQTAP